MNKLFFCLIVFVLFFVSCNTPPEKAIVETINGVEYIRNPATPMYPNRTVSFVEELSIGSNNEESEIILYQPGRFVVDRNENIYVHDRSDQVIKVFDKKGVYIRSIGGKGKGPEEFSQIGHIAFLPDGRLLVLDFGNRRNSLFSKKGEYLSNCQWPALYQEVFLTSDTSITMSELIIGKEVKMTTLYLSCEVLSSFGHFTPIKFEFKNLGNVTFSISIPFAPMSVFAGNQNRQWLYHCLNNEYLIEVYDQNGNLFRKIERSYDPVPFTKKDADEFYAGFERNPNKNYAQLAREIELPNVKTVAERLVVDNQGNLWIETNEQEEEETTIFTAYDIFDKDGVYIAKVWSSIRPMLFVKNKMYSRVTDKNTGFSSIKRYQVVWNN